MLKRIANVFKFKVRYLQRRNLAPAGPKFKKPGHLGCKIAMLKA